MAKTKKAPEQKVQRHTMTIVEKATGIVRDVREIETTLDQAEATNLIGSNFEVLYDAPEAVVGQLWTGAEFVDTEAMSPLIDWDAGPPIVDWPPREPAEVPTEDTEVEGWGAGDYEPPDDEPEDHNEVVSREQREAGLKHQLELMKWVGKPMKGARKPVAD